MSAVTTLNNTAGVDDSNPYYRPRYITDSTWGTLTNGLVSYWKLNETSGSRADSHSSHAMNEWNASVGSSSGLLYRFVADFPAQQNAALLNDDSAFDFSGNITISAWFVLRDYVLYTSVLISKGGLGLAIRQDGGQLGFQINGVPATIAYSPFVSAGEWHHVLAWWDASNRTTNIRIDNWPAHTVSCDEDRITVTSPLYIGGLGDVGSLPWYGRIGPVAIWNRLLTTQEQNAAYNGGDGCTYPMVG